jgi:DNA polymerase-1
MRDTYLEQFIREAVEIDNEYFIFPFFSLNNVKTYRSGSQAPNFQNIPVRNELAKIMTRTCLVPRKGHQLLEVDFKAMEVSIGCAYHQDPVMINYVNNSGDMHADVSRQLFFRKNDYTKFERYCAKNGFVFPAFYGSTARLFSNEHKKTGIGDITNNLWEMLKPETLKHLEDNGIKTIQQFQKHVEKIEEDFWNVRFKVYKNWKMNNWKTYKEIGYIDFFTGFRSNGILGFNDSGNHPIQGSSFHVALKTLIELNKFLRKEKFKSVIVGEIHDSILIDIDPTELNYIVKMIKKIIYSIKEEWSWINVNLKVEFEITEINQSWAYKKEINL